MTYTGKTTTALLLVGFADLVLAWPVVPGVGLMNSRFLPGWVRRPPLWESGSSTLGLLFSIGAAIQYSFIYLRTVREARGAATAE